MPVSRTGRWRSRAAWHRKTGRGVSANSRVLQHHYEDEGDKGQWVRRKVRRIEARLWRREADEVHGTD